VLVSVHVVPSVRMTDDNMPILETLAFQQPMISHTTMAQQLATSIGGDFPVLGRTTIAKELDKHRVSEKTKQSRSKNLNSNARADTLFILRQIQPTLLENMDQTSTASWKFLMKRGRSFIGEPCLAYDWDLVGEFFDTCSAIASYTERGWSIWKISSVNIDGPFVKSFIENNLKLVITDHSFLIHDGASVNACPDTAAGIISTFGDRSHQIASYSHDLSPVERGFANIWRYVRENFNRRTQTARDILNEAFSFYGVGSPGAAVAGIDL
jgi:hypothetical protein